jgi:integrase
MRIASHLTQRGSIWYFRARVPSHLVKPFGRAIVSLSLETSDRNIAKIRARRRRSELDAALEELQSNGVRPDADYDGSMLHVTDDDAGRICEQYRAQMLTNDELLRIRGISANEVALDLDIYDGWLPKMREAYAVGDLTDVYPSLLKFLGDIKLKIPRQSPSFEKLARRFQQTDMEVYEALFKRRQGVAVSIPLTAVDTLNIDGIYRCWLRQKKNRPPKTVRAFEQAFEEFKSTCSTPTASLVRRRDASAFRDALMSRGEVSARTIAKHLAFLRAAFQCAVGDGLLELNPFNGIKVAIDEHELKEKSRVPFTPKELQIIFSSDVYRSGYVPRPSLGSACYWLPLLSLYHGARLEEIAQLGTDSIVHHDEHGWYIRIRTEGTRRVKTTSSWRNVPLHPMLFKLGFIDYVQRCDEGPLFQALKADKYGKLSTVFSTWFGLHLTSLGITDTKKVFHSFRHAFIQLCKEKSKQIWPEVRKAIVGHVSADKIEAEYGEALFPLEPQVAAMHYVVFKDLDLGHLQS